ncbi:MAG TPA: helix-turn-helix transcriptional regulator [Mycobacterium sp.]
MGVPTELLVRLRDARLHKGLSQSEVAARIGTTQSAVARFESGTADPRLSTVQRYAQAVGAHLGARAADSLPSLQRTAVEVQDSLNRGELGDGFRHIVQFLDDVAALDAEATRESIRDEPDTVGDRRWDALLAGIAEFVARPAGLPVPGWASSPGRFLHRFWFVIEDILDRPAPGLAVAAFTSAPPELANRGVFVDRSSLASV